MNPTIEKEKENSKKTLDNQLEPEQNYDIIRENPIKAKTNLKQNINPSISERK